MAIDTACLAARQFRDIRILLLRHEAGACREGVAEFDERELLAEPQDDVLRQPRKMHRDDGQRRKEFDDVVAVADGVHGVVEDVVETKLFGREFPIQRKRASRDGARA